MADKPKLKKLGLTSRPSRVSGLLHAPRAGKADLVRYPTKASALRALLDAPNPGGPRTLRLTTRLLEPRPAPSEDRPPSSEARRILRQAATGAVLSPPTSRPEPRAETAPQLAPLSIQDAEGLGRLVRIRRQILDLTQQQLAESAGVGRRFISELEAGKPTVELGRALAVCRTLGLALVARQDHG